MVDMTGHRARASIRKGVAARLEDSYDSGPGEPLAD